MSQSDKNHMRNLLYKDSLEEIDYTCKNNEEYRDICNDENFWNGYITSKYGPINCFEKYARSLEKTIPVTDGSFTESVIITPEDTLEYIFTNHLTQLAPDNYIFNQLLLMFTSVIIYRKISTDVNIGHYFSNFILNL
jgi:hypothetical protein